MPPLVFVQLTRSKGSVRKVALCQVEVVSNGDPPHKSQLPTQEQHRHIPVTGVPKADCSIFRLRDDAVV